MAVKKTAEVVDGKLHAILKQGVTQPMPGMLMDDNMVVQIHTSHVVLTVDAICLDPDCGCDEPGDRCRCNTNILLTTGHWVTIQAKHADVAKLLES